MRLSPLALLASAAALARGQLMDRDTTGKKTTVFDDIKVPPLLELTPANWETEKVKTKFLLVKHYSPYCTHCIDYAPTFQTAYEFYYTSKPKGAAAGKDFFDYYDFRFGMINCVAYYDLCVEHGVTTYPMTTLYEDGEPIESLRGVKDMNTLSETIEAVLEKEKPNSRPETIVLPKPRDTESPKVGSTKVLDEELRSTEDEDILKESSEKEKSEKASDKTSDKASDKTTDKLSKQESDGKSIPDSKKGSGKGSSKETTKEDDDRWDKARSQRFRDNVQNGWPSETPAEQWNKKKPKKPAMSPNPNGASVSLNAENFQKLVTMTQDPWFIKFYAPWCPHCQAMGPAWDQLAKSMQGSLNIGEVNCDNEKRLCKDVGARAYPTILFFKGGERAEYRGLRGLGDFVQYAEKARELANGVPDVNTDELATMEEKEDVVFVYLYDYATTSEDLTALERLPLSLVGHGRLVKSNDPALYERFKVTTFPRLLVARDGRPTYYNPLTPDSIRDTRQVLDWMRSVWLPLVSELTAANARQIMDGKIIALAVLNPQDKFEFESALKEMKTAANEWMDRQIQEFQLERKKLRDAKQMRIEEAADRDDERALRSAKAIRIEMDHSGRKEVGFAWVDGVFWQRWIRQTYGIDVLDGERIIINDQDSRKYWDVSATGNYILVSRTSLMETLDKIVYGPHVIKAKLTVSILEKFFLDIKNTFVDHVFLSSASTIGIVYALYAWYRRRHASRGHFRIGEEGSLGQLKDGLLGHQNGNAKAD